MRGNLTPERLREVLKYDRSTGIFRWNIRTSNRVAIGERAGQLDHHGHRLISVDGTRYSAHRLAWLYVRSRWPDEEIDHINLVKDDNRIANLREATRNGNNRNVGVKKHNKLRVKGVCRHSQPAHKYMAQITVNGRREYLGLFDTVDEARIAYNRASTKHHGQYGRIS